MSYKNILIKEEGRISTVTINRSEVLNALNGETMSELQKYFTELLGRKDIRAVVITGSGEKAFVAGADITFMHSMTPVEGRDWGRFGQEVYSLLTKMPQIVIAAVNGYALGGGCELALACDIRIAGTNAKFGLPEIKLGIIPGFAGTQRLPKLVGKGMAKLMICTGDFIGAKEAHEIGLVEKVVEKEELMEMTMELAKKISDMPALSLMYAKQLINSSDQLPISQGEMLEAESMGICFSTEDKKEGMTAFVEKRKANFT
ncbi:MAG: enoyl-CoA hydratase-related protein [Acetivibrionales bacterium]|jgi:enoyl-CoA hydratase